ncbi:MAG: carboxypeptidase regulatory-like domain-containing protein [Kangiella sp.]|nr:carboxypeptidase regulatory-like domain-containing protein [Kangiella sp.]
MSNTSQQNLEFTAPVAKQATNLEFTLTVTDNDGATDSDIVIVTVSPVDEQKVTLQGVVTDSPIANAQVTAEIGGRTYTATADENGNYSLVIGADEDVSLGDELVVLTAQGINNQSHVKLMSAVDSFDSILSQAGSDNILTANENNSVNITHVSTAILAQLKYRNNNTLPATIEELESNSLKLDGDTILSMATLIKFIVDYGATNTEATLPEGVTDTWELVAEISNYRAFMALDLSESSKADLQAAEMATVTDQNLVTDFDTTPSFYMHTSGDIFKLYEYYEFLPTEQVNFIYSMASQQGSWLNQTTALSITLPENKVVDTILVNKEGRYIDQEITLEQVSFKLVRSFPNIDIVIRRKQGYYHYPNNPEFFDEDFDEYQISAMTKDEQPFTESEVIGQIMLPMRADYLLESIDQNTATYGPLNNSITNEASSFELTSTGSVYNTLPQLGNGTWTINQSGRLILSLNGATLEVIKFADHKVGVISKHISSNYKGVLTGSIAQRSTSSLWNDNNIAGLYELEGILSRPDMNFLLYLKPDNTGYVASGSDEDGDGVVESPEYLIEPLAWKLESGKVIVDRYRDVNNNPCEPLGLDCYLYNRREMDLFEIDGDDYYTINKHSFNFYPIMYKDLNQELQDIWYYEMFDTRSWKKHPEGTLQFP